MRLRNYISIPQRFKLSESRPISHLGNSSALAAPGSGFSAEGRIRLWRRPNLAAISGAPRRFSAFINKERETAPALPPGTSCQVVSPNPPLVASQAEEFPHSAPRCAEASCKTCLDGTKPLRFCARTLPEDLDDPLGKSARRTRFP